MEKQTIKNYIAHHKFCNAGNLNFDTEINVNNGHIYLPRQQK